MHDLMYDLYPDLNPDEESRQEEVSLPDGGRTPRKAVTVSKDELKLLEEAGLIRKQF